MQEQSRVESDLLGQTCSASNAERANNVHLQLRWRHRLRAAFKSGNLPTRCTLRLGAMQPTERPRVHAPGQLRAGLRRTRANGGASMGRLANMIRAAATAAVHALVVGQ